ncbi:MAG: ABC transporter substrate-binding protein [Nitrososphaerota archaeon]
MISVSYMRKISRTALSRVAVVVIAIVVIAAVALSAFYLTSTVSPPQPKRSDTLIIGTTDRVTQMDPAKAYDFYTWEVLNNVLEGLMKYEPGTARLTFGLAERYTVSSDGTEYVFKLKEGLKFSDGTPLDATHVKYQIDRVFATQADPSWLVTSFVESVEVLNSTAIKFKLYAPTSFFPALLATPPYFPVNPKGYPLDEIAPDSTAGGAGPYRIKSWVRDQQLILEANPYYHGPPPATKTIVIKFYKDASSLRLAVERGEIDIAWRALNPVDLEDLRKNPKLQVLEVPASYIGFLVFNTKDPPFNDVRVRKALAAAIDRKEIASKAFFDTVIPLYTLVPSFLWGREESFRKLGDANIELARSLLREAGYSEQNKLQVELWYTTTQLGEPGRDMALVIKDSWEKTGLVSVSLNTAEWATYLDNAANGIMKVYIQTWYPDYLDPDDYLTPFLVPEANSWSGCFYDNEEVTNLILEAQKITDQNARANLYKKVQEIVAEEIPFVPVFEGKTIMVAAKGVKGVLLDATTLLKYLTIYKET